MREQVKIWLANCMRNHATCKETSTSTTQKKYTPSRLLDIGQPGDDEVRLWIRQRPLEKEFCHPYMTLSHRWDNPASGDPETRGCQLKLTRENMETLRRGIRVNCLPYTWIDAIVVARAIGARFLWIDSLCIIQEKNPHPDFYEETQHMADIYGNSQCNLTAIGADVSKHGCMYERNPHTVKPCRISVQHQGRQKEYYLVPTTLWEDEVDLRPLQYRGWVFQELMLAPRLLHLSRRQIYWQCHQLKACEVFPSGIPHFMPRKDMPSLPKLVHDRESLSNMVAAQRAWEEILLTYTKLELSHPTDKICALLGVIKRLEVVLSDQCLAGLWSRYLPQQLLWRSPTSSDIMANEGRKEYRAPTWSWASTDRQIQSGPFNIPDSQIDVEVIKVSLNGKNIPLAANHPVDIPGKIKSGTLRILGSLVTAELCITAFVDGSTETKLIINERPIVMTSEDMSIDVKEDFTGRHVRSHKLGGKGYMSKSRLELFCLVISDKTRPGKETKGVECLLLRKAGDRFPDVFERYGYVKLSGYSIQQQLQVDWHKIANAEWYPPLTSTDKFGRVEISII